MKRKLTTREWMLLGVLVILAVVVAYIMLFRTPTVDARDAALAEAETCRQQTTAMQIRLAEKQRMERELDEIFARNANPLGLPDYDNLQSVMVELNAILASTRSYSLSFGTVDTSQSIVRREISINFTCDSYAAAKNVLQRLHDSMYRCMLKNLTISRGRDDDSSASVGGSIVFFECKP